MGKRDHYHDYRDSVDPEHQRWGRTYHSFPGVEECVRLVNAVKVKGTWLDLVVFELAENASDHLSEIISAFQREEKTFFAKGALMALEIAALPESVGFLAEVLREGNADFVPFAERGLKAINTREARTALFQASQAKGAE